MQNKKSHLELVDELVDDLPEPLVGQLQVDGCVGGQDVVEELAVVVVAVEPLLDRRPALHPATGFVLNICLVSAGFLFALFIFFFIYIDFFLYLSER